MSDVNLAVSEAAFEELYNRIAPTVTRPFDGSTSLGPVWFGVEGAVHIESAGNIDFEDTNTFWLGELKIAWDKLIIRLGFDIPTVEIGHFCILRMPDDAPFLAGECLWEFPGGKIFEGAPDVGPIVVDLNAIIPYIVSEVSGRFKINLVKDKDVLKLVVHKESIDVDPISISDTFGKLPGIMQLAIADAAASYVAANPQAYLLDAALGILGFPSITELLLDLLDIEDDIQEWLTKVLNVDIGIQNILYGLIGEAILERTMFEIPDPYKFIPTFEVDIADYGEFEDPQPTGPKVTLEAPRAAILNPYAGFDEDTLHINFDLGV